MATDNSVGGLYMRLGLSLDELETDFIAAERTTRENMARLNRESNLIRLRAEVEIGNLDESTDQLQILSIREDALNKQMEIQRDRIRLADAAMQDLVATHGEGSVVAQRAATALERERLALQRLERELRDVHEAQTDFNNENNANSDNSEDSLGGLLENLSSASTGKLAVLVAGLQAVKGAVDLVTESTEEMLENFHELQNQSYELDMPFDKTKDFLRQVKLGGGDIGDFEGYIRGITDAYVKGENDDPEFIALDKYGAKITDATGKLKNFKDITEEVYQAWKKANEAGEGIEFLQLTGGESGIRDAIQFFQRYEEAKEDASKVFNSGINPNELHEAERALNLLSEQASEFKDATASIFTASFTEGAKTLFEIFHSGTEFLVENKTTFQTWGFVASETISTVLTPLTSLIDLLKELSKEKIDFATENQKNEWKKFQDTIKNEGNSTIMDSFQDFLYGGIVERATTKQIEYNNAVKGATASWADFRREAEKVAEQGNPLNQYDTKRITAFRDELEDLRLELQFGDDDIGLARAQNDLWLERELTRKNYLSQEEEKILKELYAEKNLAIEQRQAEETKRIREETANRIKDLTQSTADIEYSLTHSAFEKQLYDIARWRDAQREKADTAEEVQKIIANAAMKESEAFIREMDKIQGKIESAQDKLFRLTHSQKDYDLYQAQKEYQQYVKGGIPEELAKRLYDATVRDIKRRAADDKSGNYTQPKDGWHDNPYFYDFDAVRKTAEQAEWATMDSQQMAFDVLAKNHQQLAESTRHLIGDQNNLSRAINRTVQATADLPKIPNNPDFEIIEGDRIVQSYNDSVQKIIVAQDNLAEATNQAAQNTLNFETPAPQSEPPDTNSVSEVQSEFTEMTSDLDNSITSLKDKAELFSGTMDSVSKSGEAVVTSLQNTATAIDGINSKISEIQFQAPQSQFADSQKDYEQTRQDKLVNTSLDATQSIGQIMQLAGLFLSAHPYGKALTIGGTAIDLLSDMSGKAYNFDGLTPDRNQTGQFPNQVNNLNLEPLITEVQGIKTIVESLKIDPLVVEVQAIKSVVSQMQPQQPNITVSPNINIDLGGAYVFDETMKQQLTDDVTNEVVTKVTETFNNAKAQANYSYST